MTTDTTAIAARDRQITYRTTLTGLLLASVLVVGACSSSTEKTGAASSGPRRVPTTATGAPGHTPGPSASPGCTAPVLVQPGASDHTITSGGVERVYQLVVPGSYDGRKPYPIVLALHALTVTYKVIASMTGFGDMAPKYDFIGVAPSGRVDGSTPYWMAAPTADNYDVAFIGQLLDELEATLCIDTSRVFSTGMSNGAQMSSLLACRMSDRITAIAPVSGEEFLEPCNGRPVPILAFHGTSDPILPYRGGGLNATQIANSHFWKSKIPAGMPKPLGVDESMRLWARHNHCGSSYVEERVAPEVRKRTWKGCAADTTLYIIDGGGHAWPGKPVPQFEQSFGHGTTEIDATDLMFKFFFDAPRLRR